MNSDIIKRGTTESRRAQLILCLVIAFAGTTLAQTNTPARPATPLKILATLPTYGELAREIGGDLVDVLVICRPGQDIHAVSATPSMMARCRRSQLLLYTGLDAELWLPSLLRGSGNTALLPGSAGAINLSQNIALKQVPIELSRAQGDVHAFGNSHLWTDPLAVRTMAATVRDALIRALPAHKEELSHRHSEFHTTLTLALVGWLTEAKPLLDKPVVVYHRSWIYLLDRLGLVEAGTIEPKPRVQPTARHLNELVAAIDDGHVAMILREPFHFPDATDFLQERTHSKVLLLSTHPGFPEGVDGIIAHFDYNISALVAAQKQADAPASPGKVDEG
ncbi:MAG: zinc/manganese transport system substrate-binding protein [Pseudohongiellaceae bacterium]|jgi:zinc/manganese transport system substrate-binding protein